MAQPDTRKPSSVVGLRLRPELLADVFARILTRRGLAVTRLPAAEPAPATQGGSPQASASVDVALVCGAPDRVAATVLVCLPEGCTAAAGTDTSVVVARPHSREVVEVAGVDGLVDLLVELATSR